MFERSGRANQRRGKPDGFRRSVPNHEPDFGSPDSVANADTSSPADVGADPDPHGDSLSLGAGCCGRYPGSEPVRKCVLALSEGLCMQGGTGGPVRLDSPRLRQDHERVAAGNCRSAGPG